MPLISPSVDIFFTTATAIITATYFLLKRTQVSSRSPYRRALTLLVLLHSLYIVYVITVRYPPNIFTRLGLPMNTHSDNIRALILQSAGLEPNATLPRPLETLLTRLSSFEVRNVYVRYGQSVVQNCEHCRTADEYALFALPGPLMQYIREAAVVGLLTTTESHRSRWRKLGIIAVVAAGLFEGYNIITAQITIPRDGARPFMWAEMFWLFRQLFFLLLPIVLHSLPATPPPDPFGKMLKTKHLLGTLHTRNILLQFVSGAISREPSLRESASQWWEKQRTVGQWVREDITVQQTAEKIGNGYTEGLGEAKLLKQLQQTTDAMLSVLTPPS
ncbi:hypothetical protein BDW22DRAFT_1358834 [Trametopsis cervina]|nr:hypothetical protein BDW22DRAFT_1358834 [Trametopsis cervina]